MANFKYNKEFIVVSYFYKFMLSFNFNQVQLSR